MEKYLRIENEDGKINFIDFKGNIIFKEWFDFAFYQKEIDLFFVKQKNKRKLIDIKGKTIIKDANSYIEELNLIEVLNSKGLTNFCDLNGEFIFKKWYEWIFYKRGINFFMIEQKGLYNCINLNEELQFKDWYESIEYIEDKDLFIVSNDNKMGLLDDEYNLLHNKWYDRLEYNEDLGLIKVYDRNKRKENYIDEKGKLVFKEWFNFYNFGLDEFI